MQPPILTLGHSNRDWGAFVRLLEGHKIQRLADIRSNPYSRRHPQFNRENLRSGLLELGIEYVHCPELGGLRKSGLQPSPNTAWPEGGFRRYADHMLSEDFRTGIRRLLEGRRRMTVLMCAEAHPDRCHRRLISDYLTLVQQTAVHHILGEGATVEHQLHPRARIQRGELIYPALQGRLF